MREGELHVNSQGKRYVSPADGYAFSIPPGTIPEGKTTMIFKHGIVPYGPFGPFKFPEGVVPVSAILYVHPTSDERLLKPIEIALPHIIQFGKADDRKHLQLSVFKADCNNFRREKNGKKIYNFEKAPCENLSLLTCRGFPYAKMSTQHCCYMCYGVYRKEDTDDALFCLVEAIPRIAEDSNRVIHFSVLFFLPTCLAVSHFKAHKH